MSQLIGIELGTTRVKTGIYDFEGNLLVEKILNYPLYFDKTTGKAESKPSDWWEAVRATLYSAVNTLDKVDVRGITVGSHGPSLVVLDKNYNTVYDSILWMDQRADKEAQFISSKLGKKSNDLAWFVPRILWIKNNKPELFSKIKYCIQPLDYINFKLTGELQTSYVSDEIKIWDDKIIEASGLDKKLFPKLVKMGDYLGQITMQASVFTGIPRNTRVFAGTGGVDCMEVIISSGALQPGLICDRGGTSQGVNLCWTSKFNDSKFYEAPHPLINGLFHIGGLMGTTGKSLQWYKELYYGKNRSYDIFFRDAAKSPAGAKKLIFLPYLTGERTPWWDSNARGTFFGLSLDHNEKDVARSILEGTAFGINHILNLFRSYNVDLKEVRVCGGQAASPLWNQIKADVTGLPVRTNQIIDGATLGLAIIAGKGTGLYSSIQEAAQNLIKLNKIYEPDPKNHKLYSELQDIYESLYPALKDNFHKLSCITS
ncbi:MAG TPA: FGGY family carbohydrate kinase [Victivallales bacterium]|nr:FGGY family carbohydrate kinase [Victivallales bacterium]